MGEGRIIGDGIHCKVVPKKGPLSNYFKHLDRIMWEGEKIYIFSYLNLS